MEKVHMRLTMPQAKKLLSGGMIQLTPDALADEQHWLILETPQAKKVHKAKRAGRGVRIRLTPREIEESGAGIMDFFNKLKDAGRWMKEKIIDTPFYQSAVKPLVRSAVDTGLTAIAPKLGIAAPSAKMAVDELGKRTGAFGIRKGGMLADDYSNFLNSSHPAMKPYQMPAIGGSFKVAGH